MKQTKRILAALLAAALLSGLLPAAVPMSAAQLSDAPPQTAAETRRSVMLEASGLKEADTVILGYAENSGAYYPLEWLICNEDHDSVGRTAGRLLVSKYLLPTAVTDAATGGIDTAASYGTVPMADGSTTAIHMPEDTAVLPTFKADTDYIANLGSSLSKYKLQYPADVDAGLSVRGDDASKDRRALEGARFFSLSAEEAEACIPNAITELSADNVSELLRRPYAAGFAVPSAGDRDWALRGQTLRGDALAIRKGASHFTYANSAEGLVREAGESTLSRPAFNLRVNAVSFWYSASVTPVVNAVNTAVTPHETAVVFGEDEVQTAVTEQSGAMIWRAALETLPMTYATATYHDDGTVELRFADDAAGHKIGLLTADENGSILSCGTVRSSTVGGHAFYKPEADERRLYFFLFDYDAKTHQLYTSNLIEVSVQPASAMTLGAGAVKSGDKIILGGNAATVLNAATGIAGIANTGSTTSLTATNNGYDDPPVSADDTMLMLAGTGIYVKYGSALIAQKIAQGRGIAQAEIDAEAITAAAAAKEANTAIYTQQEDYFRSAFKETYAADSPLSRAIAYTWTSFDAACEVQTFKNDSSPAAASAVAASKDNSVPGKQLFFLSAGEFSALPISTRGAIGTMLLRSAVTENFGSLSLTSDPVATKSARIATLNAFYSGTDIPEKAAFHLRKDRIVYALQSSALDRSLTASDDLHSVAGYDPSCKNWEIAVLDDTVQPFAYPGLTYTPHRELTFTVENMPTGRENSWAALLVTDRAGTVKQYGRICDLSNGRLTEFTVDTDDYDFGDRLYLIYEYESGHTEQPVVCATAPVVIWEKTLDGTVHITPNPYKPGETLAADLSDVRYAPGMDLGFCWYSPERSERILSSEQTCAQSGAFSSLAVCVYDSAERQSKLTALAEQVAELPVYPGEKDPDFFKGGTLYYGADSDADIADYAWTVVGRPTDGIAAVRDASALRQYEDASRNDAVELLRRTATPQGSTDTVLRGYMETGVMLTDIHDEAISNRTLSADAYSAEDQTVFQMSYADYLALGNYPTARFAAAQNSSWGRNYVLRNHKASKYFTVDPRLNLQSAVLGADACVREGIALNNQTVAFYSPADCVLTLDALLNCRQTPQGEWKAAVIQPELFDDFNIVHVETGDEYLNLYASFDRMMEDRYITAWGVKDGKIVWMDSKPCEGTEFTQSFRWERSLIFDELYFAARKDNGSNRSDVCSIVYAAYPTEVQVKFLLDGEEIDCDYYEMTDSRGREQTAFASGQEVCFSTFCFDALRIQKIEVLFSDGTKETQDKMNTQEYSFRFMVKGVHPTVKVYFETTPVDIRITSLVDPLYGGEYEIFPVTVTAPTSCVPGQSYDFTVGVLPGFYISEISCFSDGETFLLPNPDPITVVADGETLTGYAPGTYSKVVGDYGDSITVYVRELPFSLQLTADPMQGGTATAKLPNDRALSTLAANDEVTVYATPNDGYVLCGFTGKTQSGQETELTPDGDHATFSMPSDNVIVTAHFAKLNTVAVELFTDGAPTDGGAIWTLTDREGCERNIFADGEQSYISATADTGLVISHIQVIYSDGTCVGKGSLSNHQDLDFTVRNTDPVVRIYLTKAQVPILIETQTVDAKGKVLDTQGGSVYAPTFAPYGDSFTYNASAYEGYCISAITCKDDPVPNRKPVEYISDGETVIGYGAEEYSATADAESIYIFVTFTKITETHSITSEFFDVSLETPATVEASVTYTVDGRKTDAFYAGDEVTATVNCAGDPAVASAVASPDTVLTQTGKYTFTFTMPDEDLAITYNMKMLAVKSAYLHINEDINLIYSVQVPEGFENVTATFSFLGQTYTENSSKLDKNGRYCFEFTHITPQFMGEPVDVTVTAQQSGYTYSHANSGYSIRTYCVNMLARTDDPLLKTLLSDLLTYGAAAQTYTGYKANALVTDGLDLSPSTFTELSGLKEEFVGTADPDTFWKSASLTLCNNVDMNFCFVTDSIENLSVVLEINGRTETVADFTPVDGEENIYRLTFHGILATEFDLPVSVSFYRDGAQVGDTLKYSVNTYICRKQNDSDTALTTMVQALYNYGAAANTYYFERYLKQ